MHPSLYVLVLVIPGCAYIGSHFLAPWVPAHFLCAFAGMCVGVWLAHFIERPRHHAGAVGADIGPLVVEEFIVDAENAPVGIDGHPREMPLLT